MKRNRKKAIGFRYIGSYMYALSILFLGILNCKEISNYVDIRNVLL